MANRLNMFVLAAFVILVGANFQGSEAQTTHIVGDSTGWVIPSAGFYATWASQQTFAVGDVLVFNFATGAHDVAEVTKSAYDSCSVASPISSTTTSPASISLSSSGDHYFICRFSGHCDAGQKLTVTVPAAASPPPTAAATPPPTAAATPPPTASATPPPTAAATPPVSTATPPTTTATPPPTAAATPPPTTSNVPSTQSPPPPPSGATSLVATALPTAFLLAFALVFLH